MRYEAFMLPLTESITQLINNSQQLDTSQFAGLKSSQAVGKKGWGKRKGSFKKKA
jgi:DNA topoisomerase-3